MLGILLNIKNIMNINALHNSDVNAECIHTKCIHTKCIYTECMHTKYIIAILTGYIIATTLKLNILTQENKRRL